MEQQLARLQGESAICLNPHIAALLPKAYDGSPNVAVRRRPTLHCAHASWAPGRAALSPHTCLDPSPQGLGFGVTDKKPHLFTDAAGLTTTDAAKAMSLLKEVTMTAEELHAKQAQQQKPGPPSLWHPKGVAGVATKDLKDDMTRMETQARTVTDKEKREAQDALHVGSAGLTSGEIAVKAMEGNTCAAAGRRLSSRSPMHLRPNPSCITARPDPMALHREPAPPHLGTTPPG